MSLYHAKIKSETYARVLAVVSHARESRLHPNWATSMIRKINADAYRQHLHLMTPLELVQQVSPWEEDQ